MKYSFDDAALWIELARRYVESTGAIPPIVLDDLVSLGADDLRLKIFAENRILRYPKLRKAFLAAQQVDPDAGDEGVPGYPLSPNGKARAGLQVPHDQMFL